MTETIVVFEDEGVTALHLRTLLTSNGYSVPEVAGSADSAEDLVSATTPDLVLMDIRLNGPTDGIEASQLIHERFGVPVVILSAHNDVATQRRIEASHAYAHVTKPFEEREVIMAVRSALHRRRIERALASGTEAPAPELPELGGAVVTTDAKGRIMYMNRSAEDLTGWRNFDAFEHEATDVLRLNEATDGTLIDHPVSSILNGAGKADHPRDSILTSRTGSQEPICHRVTPVQDPGGDLLGALVTIRRRREPDGDDSPASDDIEIEAFTGLVTVGLFTDLLGSTIARARDRHSMVAVFHVDIDRPGVEAGSPAPGVGTELLAAAAARLQASVRASDVVARIGDTSFAIIQPDLEHAGGAVAMGEKLVGVFREPFVIESQEIRVTACVGAALYPVDREDPSGLLVEAEQATEQAKTAGHSQLGVCSEKVESAITEERTLGQDLDRIVMDKQLEILFRPTFDLSSRRIVGAGACLQWKHPERGVIPASDFLPVAERHGKMTEITGWVIRETLTRSVAWRPVSPSIRISMPLTGSEIRRRSLVPQLIRILEDNDFDAHNLEVELSEDVLATQPPINAHLNLQRMSQLGVGLTLDRFGYAYASMMTLKNAPLHGIKIDGSLIADITHDKEAQTIVKTTVDLARSYGLQVAADGIETEDQWRWLRYHGCELGQGEFLAGRLTARELFEGLAAQNR